MLWPHTAEGQQQGLLQGHEADHARGRDRPAQPMPRDVMPSGVRAQANRIYQSVTGFSRGRAEVQPGSDPVSLLDASAISTRTYQRR
jgi:hypothetical protein